MFHKEGGKIILIATTVTVIITLFAPKLTSILWLEKTIQITTLAFLVLILQFFRNPNRKIEPNDKVVLAPVDGKVVVIEDRKSVV